MPRGFAQKVHELTCQRCGRDFQCASACPPARCPECTKIHRAEQDKARKLRAKERAGGSIPDRRDRIYTCNVCGSERLTRAVELPTRCPDCRQRHYGTHETCKLARRCKFGETCKRSEPLYLDEKGKEFGCR